MQIFLCINCPGSSSIANLSTLQLKRRVVTIDGYTDVPSNNEQQLLQAVAMQPVSVGICGSEREFQLYSKVGSCCNLRDIRNSCPLL